MNIAKQSLIIVYVFIFSVGLLSCSSSKMMVQESSALDKDAIAALKSGLKFSTHYGIEGETDISARNISNGNLDLSDLRVHIEQASTGNHNTHTLKDLNVLDNLNQDETMDMHLSLDNSIESDFAGRVDKYNVSINYKSKTPLKSDDERNVYYISYKYKGK